MQGVCRAKDIFEIKRNALLQKVIENDSSREGLPGPVAECHKQESSGESRPTWGTGKADRWPAIAQAGLKFRPLRENRLSLRQFLPDIA